MIELRTLGAVDVRDAQGAELRGVLAHPKPVALLVYLAVAHPHGFQRRDGERARLRTQAANAAWALAEQAALEQEDVLTVTWARRAMTFTPGDEAELRRLVTLCYRVGDRAAALQAYGEFSARLLAEYGVRPSAETRDLIAAVKLSRQIRFTTPDKRLPRPPSKPAS